MRDNKQKRKVRFYNSMSRYGIDFGDANKLRLIEKTLHRWAELECGTDDAQGRSVSIERDEETDKPYRRVQFQSQSGWYDKRFPVADREKGALKRLAAIMANYPELVAYHQSDPRGCALYVIRKSDLVQDGKSLPIDANYTRGFGVSID